MAYNFRACDRDQAFLLPPDVRDWLPTDHLAWFILDVGAAPAAVSPPSPGRRRGCQELRGCWQAALV
jgi:hypothetical protein